MSSQFEPREIVIVHQAVWDGLTQWAHDNSMELHRIVGDSTYVFSPRTVHCTRCGKHIVKKHLTWFTEMDPDPTWHPATCPEGTVADSAHKPD